MDPKVGSQSLVPRVLRLGVKGWLQRWVAKCGPKIESNPWDTRLSPKAGFQSWVPRLQLPSPDEGLVLVILSDPPEPAISFSSSPSALTLLLCLASLSTFLWIFFL